MHRTSSYSPWLTHVGDADSAEGAPAAWTSAHQARAVRAQPFWRRSRSWDNRVRHLEQLASTPGFLGLRQQIIAHAQLSPSDSVLDVGAGTGLLTLAAAPSVRHVTALDIAPAMCRHLERNLTSLQITNVDVLTGNATLLPLADESVDVVISNYCLHHLRDGDKRQALAESRRVLRPGGRIVIGDMMFQIGLRTPRDRALIAGLVRAMLRRGPAGVVRLATNALRLITGRGEHPATGDWWHRALEDEGFTEVAVVVFDHEGGIAAARCGSVR